MSPAPAGNHSGANGAGAVTVNGTTPHRKCCRRKTFGAKRTGFKVGINSTTPGAQLEVDSSAPAS